MFCSLNIGGTLVYLCKCIYVLGIIIYLYTSNILQIKVQAMLYMNT